MGPTQHRSESKSKQGARYQLGRRLCLLKGCEQGFTPLHPFICYCSKDCRTAARRWQQREANRRYRSSEQGKACRRVQCRRYRQRLAERSADDLGGAAEGEGGEGYQKADPRKFFSCPRPGCEERFSKTTRSPLQKFCSAACRQALRRVRLRDRRWERILGWAPSRWWSDGYFW